MANTPKGIQSITPYLTVDDAAGAITFYRHAFGAKEVGRITLPNGKIGHAEISIEGSSLFIADKDGKEVTEDSIPEKHCPHALVLYVSDVDASFTIAVQLGSTAQSHVEDRFYGARSGMLMDPFGVTWILMTHQEELSFEELQDRSDELFGG